MPSYNLLTTNNPKALKGESEGFITFLLHLAPFTLSGFNTCPGASNGCAAACLNTAGRGGMFKKGETTNVIQNARIRKTQYFFNNRDAFMADLVEDIRKAIGYARKLKMTPVFRLNATSDIRWETVPVGGKKNIMALFPNVQFYDYTKLANRRNLPRNYHLTFSLAEHNRDNAETALANGLNVAAVFAGVLPETFMGVPVVNGDATDLRFRDPVGVVVGLKAKGRAKHDTSGFVQRAA